MPYTANSNSKICCFENKKERISKHFLVRRILVDSNRTRVFRRIFDMPYYSTDRAAHICFGSKIKQKVAFFDRQLIVQSL